MKTIIWYPAGKPGNTYHIPDGVTSIGEAAFSGCTGLTSVTIPDSITSIGQSAFENCGSLTDVYYWGTAAEWDTTSIKPFNTSLTGATRWYAGKADITPSTPEVGEVNPVVTIKSDRPFAPIMSRSTTMNNVTVDEGTTGLTLSSVSLDASDTTNKTMLLGFTGSSKGGDIEVTFDSKAFAGPENFTTADPFTVNMPAAPATEQVTITVQFVDEDNNVVATEPILVDKDSGYDVTDVVTRIPGGYEPNGEPIGDLTGTADSDKTIDVPVKEIPIPEESGPWTWVDGFHEGDAAVIRTSPDERAAPANPTNDDLEWAGHIRPGYMFTEWDSPVPGSGEYVFTAQWVEPKMDVTITPDKSAVTVGDNVTYTITVTNKIDYDVTVDIVCGLPEGLEFISLSRIGDGYDETDRTVTWNGVEVSGAGGEATTRTVVARAITAGTVTNSATATLDYGTGTATFESDDVTVNVNPASEPTPGPDVPPAPDLWLYVLTYDRNYGDNSIIETVDISSAEEQCSFTVRDYTLPREGYTFLGWAETRDATAPAYRAGDTVTLTSANYTKTLYAVWQRVPSFVPPIIPGPSVAPAVTPSTPKIPALIPSPIQDDVIRTDRKEIPDWIDRLDLPDYAQTFYDVMAGNTGNRTATGRKQGIFEVEQNFVLLEPAGGGTAQVEEIEVVEFSMRDMYAGGEIKIQSTIFEDENFYHIPADDGDKTIHYAGLDMGSVVRTSAFNGVFVTKIPHDGEYDTKKKEACEYIAAVYHAFDRDHPEVFWLSGKCKARIVTVTDSGTGEKTAYFFLVLADKDGFTMCSPDWTEAGAITAGLARRDAAVAEILETVTASDTADKIRQINKYLTEHNQYNTTPDLTTIGNEPHECLSALEGRIGTNGPVCDGYSRACKVLCDQLSIPCVLETGWAKARANTEAEFHMWNLIQVGGTWYGTDITWDDPTVKGIVAAISGKENENYLLVGTDTEMNNVTFAQSHVVQNQATEGGVDFNNGPAMSPIAYAGLPAPVFADVPSDAYYYDGVLWAMDRGITTGTSATTFSPGAPCTQIQILTFLWRAVGKPVADVTLPVSVTGADDYVGAAKWAYSMGMIGADFNQNTLCTRASAMKFMWQAEGSPAASGGAFTDVPSDADYAQAVAWAVARKVTEGASATTFAPDQICTRAQIVAFLCRDRA